MAEVALSFVLLIGSGLMFRSFLDLQAYRPRLRSHNMLKFQLLGARLDGPTPEARAAVMNQVHSACAGFPALKA